MSQIKTTSYGIICSHCERRTLFRIADVPELEGHIDARLDDARDDERDEVETEFAGHIDPSAADWRHLLEVGAALRRRDIDEVTALLRAMASALGGNLLEEFERGMMTSVPLFERAA